MFYLWGWQWQGGIGDFKHETGQSHIAGSAGLEIKIRMGGEGERERERERDGWEQTEENMCIWSSVKRKGIVMRYVHASFLFTVQSHFRLEYPLLPLSWMWLLICAIFYVRFYEPHPPPPPHPPTLSLPPSRSPSFSIWASVSHPVCLLCGSVPHERCCLPASTDHSAGRAQESRCEGQQVETLAES